MADQELFVQLADSTRANLAAIPGSPKPADLAIEILSQSHKVMFLLLPLGISSGSSSSSKVDRPEPYATPPKGTKGGKDRKGDGKGKGKGTVQLPSGCSAFSSNKKPLYFAFNL